MIAVARVLNMRHNQLHVSTRGIGGGFGGKAHISAYHAAAAALAARKFQRQVRLVVGAATDVGMAAGRCPMQLEWTAGVDAGGRLTALQLNVLLMVRGSTKQGWLGSRSALLFCWCCCRHLYACALMSAHT